MTDMLDASATFAAAPESAAAAREFVGAALRRRGCPSKAIDTVSLLTSEVATNAVVHARTDFQLRLRVTVKVIRVEVEDEGMGAAVLTYADQDEVRGRGLYIVDALADRWGDERRSGGRHRVWFELQVQP
jgi:anti-sigma regulatory factor (Ser/Thr protein kinase)